MATIVVGIDGSSEAMTALRWAVAEAARREATVRAVAAYDYLIADVLGAPVQVHPIAGDPARAFAHAVAAVDAVKGDLPPGVTVEPEAVEGEPGRILCEVAEGADLLVVARHGTRGRRHHLGSVASYVVHHSPVPVVVLPAGTE
jgi:nucleotide-binding universal stress UspA family protein